MPNSRYVSSLSQLRVSNFSKDGLLRLRFDKNRPELQIWNTPSPPHPASCRLLDPATWRVVTLQNLSARLHAVELNRCRGLTFFFCSRQLFGIHVHWSEDSSALETYESFPNSLQQAMDWIYMPIAPRDQVLVLGSRKTDFGFNVLVSCKVHT